MIHVIILKTILATAKNY